MYLNELPAANAIRYRDLYLKPKNLKNRLSKTCRMIILEAEDPDLPLGRSGSSTLIEHNGKKYVVLTRHELGILPGEVPDQQLLDTIRVVGGSDTLVNVPLSKCIFETSNPDNEFHDLLIFEVADSWAEQHLDEFYFLRLQPFSTSQKRMSWVYGCPTIPVVMDEYVQAFEPGKVGTIHLKTIVADCIYDSEYISQNDHYRHYLGGPESYTADGFSGGPVMSLIGQLENLEAVLDGIVVRAGKGHLYIVDVDYLLKVLN